MERHDLVAAERISDHRKIIGFRNRLAHGYDHIIHAQVWTIARQALPVLLVEVELLLRQAES